MSPENIMKKINKFGIKRVCITGGEPLLQDLGGILDLLDSYSVSIETNGTLDIERYCGKATISLDVKCPCSGNHQMNRASNLALLTMRDQVKFIVRTREDLTFAYDTIGKHSLVNRTNVFLIPVFGADTRMIADEIISKRMDVRMGLQMHKHIWSQHKRGV